MKKIQTILRSILLPSLTGGPGWVCALLFFTLHSSLFTSCSSEQVEPPAEEQDGVPIQLVGYVPEFQESLEGTRAEPVWMPSGYTTMEDVKSIGVFLTQDPASVDKRRIYHYPEGEWYLSGKSIPEGDFFLYGYLPYNSADVSITPKTSTYEEGATLTFSNMGSLETKDICVIVGASHGTGDNTPVSLQPGKFNCTLQSGGSGHENYLFLLCDHLYARLDFKFRVDNTYESNYYASLRDIKLRKLELMGYTYPLATPETVSPMKETGSISITLTANNTSSTPVPGGELLFTLDGSAEDMDPILLFEGEKLLPSTTYSTETGFIPYFNLSGETGVFFILRSTYDVYDKSGNLIRQGCVAENKIEPAEIFNSAQLRRGWKYTVQLKLKPTYLYYLSEPDLDNPSVTFE